MDNNLIKRLIATIRCSNCGLAYQEDHVKIIDQSEDVWFLKVFCPSCRVKSLIAAVIRKEKKFQAITDLTSAEVSRFKCLDAVGEDDILDMHRFLKEFNGDFAGLFREK